MKLTEIQKTELKNKYGGRCSYCSDPLSNRWQKDHFLPVERVTKYVKEDSGVIARCTKGKPITYTVMLKPENDNYDNLMPACAKCNNDKSSMDIEIWRQVIKHRIVTINKDPKYASYQKAKRFGLVVETNIDILFWFEVYDKSGQASQGSWDGLLLKKGLTCIMKNGGNEVFTIDDANSSFYDWNAPMVVLSDKKGSVTPMDQNFFFSNFEPLLLKDLKQVV